MPPPRLSKESDPLHPRSPYSASKAGGDMQCLAFVETYALPVVIARPCNNVGPNQYPEKMAPLFITNALEDEPLPVYGDGRQVRDWLFVDDDCEALDLLLHKGRPGEVYNIGAANERPNLETVETILDAAGKAAQSDPLRGGPPRPRPPLRAELPEDAHARLVAAPRLPRRLREDGRLVRRQPLVVGEDQVRLLPRLLREAVRRPARVRRPPLGRASRQCASSSPAIAASLGKSSCAPSPTTRSTARTCRELDIRDAAPDASTPSKPRARMSSSTAPPSPIRPSASATPTWRTASTPSARATSLTPVAMPAPPWST